VLLGVRLGEKGQLKQAAALFESALARPDYAEAWLNLSVCYDALARHDEARQAFVRAFTLDRETTLRLLRDFLANGKPEAAQDLLGHLHAVRAARPE
jgi:Tfp pilus assembly protein PilF